MQRRTFLRFLGLSPAMSAVDMTNIIKGQRLPTSIYPEWIITPSRNHIHLEYDGKNWYTVEGRKWLNKNWPELTRGSSTTHQNLNGS